MPFAQTAYVLTPIMAVLAGRTPVVGIADVPRRRFREEATASRTRVRLAMGKGTLLVALDSMRSLPVFTYDVVMGGRLASVAVAGSLGTPSLGRPRNLGLGSYVVLAGGLFSRVRLFPQVLRLIQAFDPTITIKHEAVRRVTRRTRPGGVIGTPEVTRGGLSEVGAVNASVGERPAIRLSGVIGFAG